MHQLKNKLTGLCPCTLKKFWLQKWRKKKKSHFHTQQQYTTVTQDSSMKHTKIKNFVYWQKYMEENVRNEHTWTLDNTCQQTISLVGKRNSFCPHEKCLLIRNRNTLVLRDSSPSATGAYIKIVWIEKKQKH